ncbi:MULTISPECIES: alkane oxidation protein activator PraB [unclassified Pseudomonas]|uniref:alkane oxidation protein activator PraB n=1 Tax=unclassified Pseudomonas TaxID=196821 RepID=UPI00159FC058|nr:MULTISPECIES: alkane oxidation protein activator PraB [unclassified Pseudomonas]NVZ12348.1 protein activator of alkane oxidation PraB [Pseudomonas sp. IPO3775]NWA75254.1 protein activator of alkane oxidation PraB [Pseudomonas sp. C8002]
MKSLKTLVSLTALTVCMGAASMASAATITPNGAFTTNAGTIVVTSPSSLGLPVTCGITFSGTVTGGVATITGATLTGGGLCAVPVLKNIPSPGWVLTATAFNAGTGIGAGTVTGVGWTITPGSDCGPSPLTVAWNQSTHTLSASSQTVSGNCSVRSLSVVAPTLSLN